MKAGDSLQVVRKDYGIGEKVGQPASAEKTINTQGTFNPIVCREGIAQRALINPSNPAPAFIIPEGCYPILDEELRKCAGCTGCWDNFDTNSYCRYGQNPKECRGPK